EAWWSLLDQSWLRSPTLPLLLSPLRYSHIAASVLRSISGTPPFRGIEAALHLERAARTAADRRSQVSRYRDTYPALRPLLTGGPWRGQFEFQTGGPWGGQAGQAPADREEGMRCSFRRRGSAWGGSS